MEKAGGIGIAGENLTRWLEGWIDDVLAERAAGQRGTNEGPAFAAAQREAQRRFDTGRLDEASQPFIDEFEREERAERERQEERTHARLRLLEKAIEWDKLALNGAAAAEKFVVLLRSCIPITVMHRWNSSLTELANTAKRRNEGR